MSKDPAVLFYTSDFLTGTMTMSNEHVGMFIRLLCLQHQKGRLKEKDMLNICKSYIEDIFEKFEKDDNGLFFNKRLDDESVKRKAYSLSRSKNRKKKNNICKSYEHHMENENENENKDINIKKNSKKFKKPTPLMLKNYFFEQNSSSLEAEKFFDYYEANGWKVGRNPMKDWKATARNWVRNSYGNKKDVSAKDKMFTSMERMSKDLERL